MVKRDYVINVGRGYGQCSRYISKVGINYKAAGAAKKTTYLFESNKVV